MRRTIAIFLLALLFVAALPAAVAGCGSAAPPSVATSPSAWPLAPAVTPSPGEPFVGYWTSDQLAGMDSICRLEVLKGPKGYEVSRSGWRRYVVPMKNGRLVIQVFRSRPSSGGAWVVTGYTLAWERGRCVLYVKDDSNQPAMRQPLTRTTRTAYVEASRVYADRLTRASLMDLALGVDQWTTRRGQGPPRPEQMQAGSAFDTWISKLSGKGGWVWPENPFTGRPVAMGEQPGDFTYSTDGKAWRMTGHLSNGAQFNPLE